jgi:DNA-3-methyladenine glycosylase II
LNVKSILDLPLPPDLLTCLSHLQIGAFTVVTEHELPPFDLRLAMDTLAAKDLHLAPLIKETQEFRVAKGVAETPYEVLVEAITHQSISGRAAAAIFGRVKALGSNGRIPTPDEMVKLTRPTLRKAGLSAAKILAMKDLAQKTIDGVVPTLEEAHKLSDEELVDRLVSVRGIGAWTVEMFLIFRLGRPDVLPIHDLGVRKGWAITYGKKHMPAPKELLKFAERWRPYRTVASWYMWRACQRAGHAALRKIRPHQSKARPRSTPAHRNQKNPPRVSARPKPLAAKRPARQPH